MHHFHIIDHRDSSCCCIVFRRSHHQSSLCIFIIKLNYHSTPTISMSHLHSLLPFSPIIITHDSSSSLPSLPSHITMHSHSIHYHRYHHFLSSSAIITVIIRKQWRPLRKGSVCFAHLHSFLVCTRVCVCLCTIFVVDMCVCVCVFARPPARS